MDKIIWLQLYSHAGNDGGQSHKGVESSEAREVCDRNGNDFIGSQWERLENYLEHGKVHLISQFLFTMVWYIGQFRKRRDMISLGSYCQIM